MEKYVKITFKKETYECNDCGFDEARVCLIESNIKEVSNVKLGSAHCCSMQSSSIREAILFVLKALNFPMEFNMLKIKGTSYDIDDESDQYRSEKDCIKDLNTTVDISKYNGDIENIARFLLENHGVALEIVDEISDDEILN